MKAKCINNINVITDLNDYSNLVTVSYEVNVGAYDEDETNLGITHLIEHLLFKGTLNRTADEINKYIESLGGSLNAYTTYTYTKYYCTVPKKYYKEAIEFLNDLIFYNTIPEKEFELEKNVVLNELRMYEDDPKDKCFDNLMKIVFNNDISRQVVGGNVESVSKITREQVIDFIDSYYTNKNIKILITGSIDDTLNDLYDFINDITIELTDIIRLSKKHFKFNIKQLETIEIKQDLFQSILCWCFIGPSMYNKDYLPFQVLINYLGGNMSSVFYTEVREKLGLVYTINMNILDEFEEYSIAKGYTSLQKENIDKVKTIIEKEINNLHMTNDMLDSNKKYLIGELLSSIETTEGMNEYIGRFNINYNELIEQINKVTILDIERVIRKYFRKNNIYYSSIISQ